MIWQPPPPPLLNPNSLNSLWSLLLSHPTSVLSAFPTLASLLILKHAKHFCTLCCLRLEHASPRYLPVLLSPVFKSLFKWHLLREVSPARLYKITPSLIPLLSLTLLNFYDCIMYGLFIHLLWWNINSPSTGYFFVCLFVFFLSVWVTDISFSSFKTASTWWMFNKYFFNKLQLNPLQHFYLRKSFSSNTFLASQL